MSHGRTHPDPRRLARNNPFSASRQESVSWIEPPQGPTLEQIASSLRRLDYRAAIVGPKGSGKTTLLKALEPMAVADGRQIWSCTFSRDLSEQRIQLREARKQQSENRILFVDGIERLSSWRRIWLLKRHGFGKTSSTSGGIVATIHRRSRALPTLVETEPDFETFVILLGRLDVATKDVVGQSKTLFERHNGNIRLVLRSLYDQYAAGRFRDIDAQVCPRP